MSRFTDPLLFGALFLLSAITWAILDWRDAIPPATEGGLAPMTVAVVIIIATPALLLVTVVALVRALVNARPRVVWSWMTGGSALAALVALAASAITSQQGLELGFSTTVWFLAITAFSSLVALILALTGAVPTPKPAEVPVPAKDEGTSEKKSRFGRTKDKGDVAIPPAAPAPADTALVLPPVGADFGAPEKELPSFDVAAIGVEEAAPGAPLEYMAEAAEEFPEDRS